MTGKSWKIAVVGGGIGGLTLALALRDYGIEVDIYEQTGELREVGAAVALSGNGTRFYERFGLRPKFDEVAFSISTLIHRDGRDGRVIGRNSGSPSYEEQFGACYWGVHRADLQAILSEAVGMEQIHLGKRLISLKNNGREVILSFEDGSVESADLVIGADGVRSRVRRWMLGYDDAMYSGCSGFRGIVAPEKLDLLPDPDAIQFWMGPGGHLLHYPIGPGDHNFLLVQRGPSPWIESDWVTGAREGEQLKHFSEWHPAVVQMISAVPTSSRWALFHRPPLGRWSKGRVTLVGDAAHAMVPHHGQGANQAIEDVIVLAKCFAENGPDQYQQAQENYESLRRGRTRKIQHASLMVADMLHLPAGPLADKRNSRLARRFGMMQFLGWIHEFDSSSQLPETRSGGTWL